MGYRASNARDLDTAAEWRRLPLAERLRRVNWTFVVLTVFVAAAFAAKRWLG
jgi:hypothetical protein